MNLPYKFPDPQVEARRRALEFQALSSSQRWAEVAALVALGWKMVALSPKRRSIEQRMEQEEVESQRIQQELFRNYLSAQPPKKREA